MNMDELVVNVTGYRNLGYRNNYGRMPSLDLSMQRPSELTGGSQRDNTRSVFPGLCIEREVHTTLKIPVRQDLTSDAPALSGPLSPPGINGDL